MFGLVEHDVTWFERKGILPLRITFDITEEVMTPSDRLIEQAVRSNPTHCGGYTWSASGLGYPQFVREAGLSIYRHGRAAIH
jgi:hypothetical protein